MKRKTVKTIACLVCVVLTLAAVAAVHAEDDAVARSRELYQKAMSSYNDKDYAEYLGLMKEINGIRRNHPAAMYNLAGAYALVGEETEALRWLGRLADMGLFVSPQDDADFDSIADSDDFTGVVDRFGQNARPVGGGDTAFTIPQKKLIPEGIAHDPLTGNFYVSSVYKRAIVEVLPGDSHIENRVHASESRTFATYERGDGLWSVFGLGVDPNRRVLWACSSAIRQTPGIGEDRVGYAGVFEYDLATRLLIKRYVLSNRRASHLFGDLVLSRAGMLYVTDSLDRAVYRLDGARGTFDRWLESDRFTSPQGIAFSHDERYLFMADYSFGIFRIDVESRDIRLLPYPDDMVILGIDGLAGHGKDLVAIQNGVRPHRIIRLRLNARQDRITAWEVLQANHPEFNEPTLGVVVRGTGDGSDAYYFVANSHWGAFDREGGLRKDAGLTPPVIIRLPLE
jgi:sugar lactone lactonase YvrE